MGTNDIVDIQNNGRSLIIIGNGFDLHCGLASRFSDFFKWSLRHNKSYDDFRLALKDPNTVFGVSYSFARFIDLCPKLDDSFSAFDAMFMILYLTCPFCPSNVDVPDCWNGVEAQIKDSFFGKVNFSWEKVIYLLKHGHPTRDENNLGICERRSILMYHLLAAPYKGSPYANRRDFTNKEFYEFLFGQLRKFENNFTNYLKNEINTKTEFENNAKSLLNKITSGLPDSNFNRILSFNYTDISHCTSCECSNIHGCIKNNDAIIGIDYDNINSELMLFSKTYRKGLISKNNGNDFDYNFVNHIFIYGHSLNDLDYQFFSTIFNYINLINRSNEITFHLCYSEIKDENVDKVTAERTTRERFLNYIIKYSTIKNAPDLVDAVTSHQIESKLVD